MKRRRKSGTAKLIQLVSFVLAAILGSLILIAKVSAQPKPPPAPKPSASIAAPKPKPSASAQTPPPVDAGAATTTAGDGGIQCGDGGALDYAEVQTDDDFPKDMSEEERDSIGTGKVPIHRTGKYHSPFAHPCFGGTTTAKIGLVLNSIENYDIQTGTFGADFFLSITGDKDLPDLKLTFTNGKEVNETVVADTPTFKLFRYSGQFASPIDLRRYPFDQQSLNIEMEDVLAGVDQLVFVPDQNRTSLDEGFSLPGWGVAAVGAKSYRHLYPPRFDRDDLYVSRYKFTLTIERFATSAAFSVFVPAFIIVLISLTGMWVPPDELEVRSNAGAPMLAAAVLFHYSLIQALPATGYLTRADKLMLGVYIALMLNMTSTWLFMIVKEENVEKVFRLARTWVPIITAILMAAASFA